MQKMERKLKRNDIYFQIYKSPPDKTLQMLRFFMLPPRTSQYSVIHITQTTWTEFGTFSAPLPPIRTLLLST